MSVHPRIISTKRHYLVIGNVKMLQKFKQAKQFFAGTFIRKFGKLQKTIRSLWASYRQFAARCCGSLLANHMERSRMLTKFSSLMPNTA